jgi:hypothetical protein
MCGAPLAYVLRDNAVPTAEDMDRDFGDINDTLEATLSHTCPYFRKDSTRVYDILKPLIIEGDCWGFVLPLDRRRDGRAAFLTLKEQAEGPANCERRKTIAYQKLKTKFTGFSRKFTFDDYIAVYQKAFNELLYLGEPVPETKKVSDFLSNITDNQFKMIKTVVSAMPAL